MRYLARTGHRRDLARGWPGDSIPGAIGGNFAVPNLLRSMRSCLSGHDPEKAPASRRISSYDGFEVWLAGSGTERRRFRTFLFVTFP